MPTLDELYQLRYSNAALRNAVVAACALAAFDILNEDPATKDHALRVEWANEALQNTPSVAERMLWAVVTNPTIAQAALAGKPTDNDVKFVVHSFIDTFAVASKAARV